MPNFTWYVAGPWLDRHNVREIIAKVNAAGWQTCSHWAQPEEEDSAPGVDVAADGAVNSEELRRKKALRDVEDVIKADGLIYVNSAISEGKATELGLSIATLKPIIIIGERFYADRFNNNIFLNLNIPAFPTIEEALKWLEEDAGQGYLAWVEMQQMFHFMGQAEVEAEDLADVEFPSE